MSDIDILYSTTLERYRALILILSDVLDEISAAGCLIDGELSKPAQEYIRLSNEANTTANMALLLLQMKERQQQDHEQ